MSNSSHTAVPGVPLRSRYALDPNLRPLLEEFVASLDASVDEMAEVGAEGDWLETCRLAHRLRGEAATYGYAELADAVALLEAAAREPVPPTPSELLHMTTLLKSICARTRLGLHAP